MEDVQVDHYAILGLPSGEEGTKLSDKDISKAYRSKALELHPDKRLNDPSAHANFQKLKTSYEILKDEKARKLFNDLLCVKHEKVQCQSRQDSKRRKLMSDLEERERAAFARDPSTESRYEEEKSCRKLREEIARIRAMHAGKAANETFLLQKETRRRKECMGGRGGESALHKEKALKVSWEKVREYYSGQRLMASKDAAVDASGIVCGDLSNPLLVLPLQSAAAVFPSAWEPVEPDGPKLSNLVDAGYQAFEDSVLKKLQKAAERQK